ncbi:siphovirus ReqiPepy6 Gp37-like family protein [Clostridium sp. DL1XJH146]
MELYIFDRQLNFKGILDDFTSLMWTRRYYKSGEFELHCALTSTTLGLLSRENIIYKKDDDEAGYIEYRNLKQNTDGSETLVLKGRFLLGYLSRRIIWGTEILNTTTENAMRTLVNKNCVMPIDSNRIIDNLSLGTLNNFTHNVNYQVSYKNLADELENLSNVSGLGHRVKLDIKERKLIFDVYEGLDRSINQSINPRAIFSKEFENILEQEYVDNFNDYKNLVLVGGVGEGTSRKLATVGNASGLDRFEVFEDQKSLSNENDGVVMNDTDYINLLIEKGNSKLSETKEITTFESKINLNSNLEYKKDFDLGDIVTHLSKKWGVILNPRITEVEEIYESGGKQINAVFGNNIPTIIDKINQKLR